LDRYPQSVDRLIHEVDKNKLMLAAEMINNYQIIIDRNLRALFADDLPERAGAMATDWNGRFLTFKAFGVACRITPEGIFLGDRLQTGPVGIIVSLYALHAIPESFQLEPFKSFKEIPNSAPYTVAFASHTERILVPKVDRLMKYRKLIMDQMDGFDAPAYMSGDEALVVKPLPKIALCYIFYAADEDFMASATCLYSNNANSFMPVDGLADVGEYTSRAMLDLIA